MDSERGVSSKDLIECTLQKKRLAPNIVAGHKKVLTRYYNRGATYGMSVASMMLILGDKLGRSDNESLW